MKIFSEELVNKAAVECKVADLSRATIGEILLVAQYLEKETGIPFIRMDQGSPGLPVNQLGVEAEKAALDRGVGSQYPAAAGVPELKNEALRGEFDILLVFMFDRLGRKSDETPFIVEWLCSQGIKVWSVNEGEQRFDSHTDRLTNYIILSTADSKYGEVLRLLECSNSSFK